MSALLQRVLPFVRQLLSDAIEPGDIVVDATVGNGHDTLFLAQLVGPHGRVYGFDVQQEAIQTTTDRLTEHELATRVTLFHAGHQEASHMLPPVHDGKVKAVVFNLGYLPGGDHRVVTRPKTTIAAIEFFLDTLLPGGIIAVVVYPGHPEGAVERDYLLRYIRQLNQQKVSVLQYGFVNQVNKPPFLLAFEKQ